MNKEINYNYKLPPFKWFCLTNFPFIEADFDALTYYELLCKVVQYLNDLNVKTNEIGEQTENLTNAFNELKNYVDTYFDNLDVQEEINNKLDDMVESGEFEEILNNLKYYQSNINYNKIYQQLFKNGDNVYGGISHYFVQGFTMISDEIGCFTLISNDQDDYAKIIVMNIYTGEVIKENYIQTYHSNSISYNPTTNKLYIAHCSERGQETTKGNAISVVDYDSLTIESEINIINIPSGHRIRSFCYDKINDKYYAGDLTTVYEIDLTNSTIIKTINLDVIDDSGYNQTIKVYGNKIYAFNMLSCIIYDLNGKLIKVLPIEQIYQNYNTGEPEDFEILNDEIIFITSANINSREEQRQLQIYKGNLFKNNVNVDYSELGKAITTNITIYVDNTSNEIFEDGSVEYPFKNLQNAINKAKCYNKGATIDISGNNYDEHVFINTIPFLQLKISSTIDLINTIEISSSNVQIYRNESSDTISLINKIILNNAKLEIINGVTKISTDSQAPVQVYRNSTFVCQAGVEFDAQNSAYACIHVVDSSNCSVKECTFNNFDNSDAINTQRLSHSKVYRNTYNKASGEVFNVTNNSSFDYDGNTIDIEKIYLSTNSKCSCWVDAQISEKYYGDIATNFKDVYAEYKIVSKLPSVSGTTRCDVFTRKSQNSINGIFLRNNQIDYGFLQVDLSSETLSISDNRRIKNSSGTLTYETKSDNTSDTNFMSIKKLYYHT